VQGVQGVQGVKGDEGPSAVSADSGNIAVLGTDDLIFVPDTVLDGTDEVIIQNSLPVGGTWELWVDQDAPAGDASFSHAALLGLTGDDHPQYLSTARGDARYVPLTGGTMSGLLTLSGVPVNPNHAARLADVDAVAGRSIIAGNGLTGGGTLAASRTINVVAGDGITVGADVVLLDTTFTDNLYVNENQLIRDTAPASGIPAGGAGTVWIQY